jgi:hypothetical protein
LENKIRKATQYKAKHCFRRLKNELVDYKEERDERRWRKNIKFKKTMKKEIEITHSKY